MQARRWLLGLIVGASVLRVGSALAQGNGVAPLPGIFDQLSYHPLALRLLEGHGFSFATDAWPATRAGEPTAHWSFLYTLYLAGAYAIFGPNPLAARIIQAVAVGALHTWLAWRIARRAFDPVTGLLAAAASAFYIYFVYYAGALMTEPFYITAILWTLDVGLRLDERLRELGRAGWGPWLELGLAIGVTALLRQLFLLFTPVLALWLLLAPSPETGRDEDGYGNPPYHNMAARLGGLALAAGVAVALILPWTVRNYRAFGTFTPLNTNSGYAFFWGNHPIYGTHFVGILPDDGPSYQELIPAELRGLNEAELDQALLAEGVGFVTEDPARYVLLSLSRTREYFKFWPAAESSALSNVARVGSFGIALPFIILGLIETSRVHWRAATAQQRRAVALLLLFAAVYTLLHLLTWALIRYRLPVDAVLLVFAAYGVRRVASAIGLHLRIRSSVLG